MPWRGRLRSERGRGARLVAGRASVAGCTPSNLFDGGRGLVNQTLEDPFSAVSKQTPVTIY